MSAGPRPAIVVMAHAPRPGEVLRALEPVLGTAGCARVQSALIVAAVEWAQQVAPSAVHLAYEPPDAAAELREVVGAGAALLPQHGAGLGRRLENATSRLFGRQYRPVLAVWPDLPRWRPAVAAAALDDLSAGCDLTLGPVIDGGFYLIGIDRPQPALFELPDQAWRTPDVMDLARAASREAGLGVGILRAERALRGPADLRAARADPMVRGEVGRMVGAAPG